MKQFFIFFFLFFLLSTIAQARKHTQSEKAYINQYCETVYQGKSEVVIDGGRVDCLTDEYVIEFEFIDKWKEAIGQSLFYALKTNKKPAIVALMESYRKTTALDRKDLEKLKFVCKAYDIEVFVINPSTGK